MSVAGWSGEDTGSGDGGRGRGDSWGGGSGGDEHAWVLWRGWSLGGFGFGVVAMPLAFVNW